MGDRTNTNPKGVISSSTNSNTPSNNTGYTQGNNNKEGGNKYNRWQGNQGNNNNSSSNYNETKDYPPKELVQKQPYQLRNKFHLSFMNPNDNITNLNFGTSLISIGDIETIEDFFNYYCHIYRPQDLQSGSFYLFLKDIQPMWEHSANKGGGRFNIRMKKGYVNKIWEDLIMGFLGETCEEKDLLNGLVLQIKSEQDVIQLWVKDFSKCRPSTKQRIQTWIAVTIGFDQIQAEQVGNTFNYQPHQKETKTHAPIHKSSANPVRKL